MVKLMTMDSSTLATDGTIETFKGSRSLRKNAELLPGHSSKSNGSEVSGSSEALGWLHQSINMFQ